MKPRTRAKHILVAVCGMTPQVVTETVFALRKRRSVRIDEIVILTTQEGKVAILGDRSSRTNSRLIDELRNLSNYLRIPPPKFSPSDSIHIADREEGFSDLACRVIQSLAAGDNNIIHASLAGGRKTMSASMVVAMMLFARPDDELTHVIVSGRFEHSGKYYPLNVKDERELHLLDFPFIRLRGKIEFLKSRRSIPYAQLVKMTQTAIDASVSEPTLIIDESNCTLGIGDSVVKLTPLEFAVYQHFAVVEDFVPGGPDFPEESKKAILRSFNALKGENRTLDDYVDRKKESQLRDEMFSTWVLKSCSTIKAKLKRQLPQSIPYDLYSISVGGYYANKRYGVRLPISKRRFTNRTARRDG